ncbi:hypothetical protein DFH27DRAFT_304493 [Peziza echinospora]|nr:hypothetical protein DFH27DRAFT_304493 [Peziza echinospora]
MYTDSSMAPIILGVDSHPFGLFDHYDGQDGQLHQYNDIYAATSGPCSAPMAMSSSYQGTTSFPRSLSNSSTLSAASSADSMDSYSMVEEDWSFQNYNTQGLALTFMDQNHNPHMQQGPYVDFSPSFDGHSAPLMSSPSYSQDHEPQQQPLQFHHHMSSLSGPSGGGSPALLPSSLPLTPPLSGAPKGVPPHHHHQFPVVQPRLQTSFKRPFQTEPNSAVSAGPHSPPSAKRRKSMSAATPSGNAATTPKSPKQSTPLTEDDNLLLRLKDEENLPWKLIQKRFLEMSRGEFKVPTLQMRYKRLKEKMRVWEADDVGYLKEAKDAVSKEYWEMVSRKMVEMGCKKKIPGVACERKWREIDGSDKPECSSPRDTKSGSPPLGGQEMVMSASTGGSGMASPPATRSPSRRSSVSGPIMQTTGGMPLPSSLMMAQQLAASTAPASMLEVQMIVKRELGTVTEGEEM